MIVNAHKLCDICGQKIAEKRFVWHTDKDYITLRRDNRPRYQDMGAATVRGQEHLCIPCWWAVRNAAEKLMEEANE